MLVYVRLQAIDLGPALHQSFVRRNEQANNHQPDCEDEQDAKELILNEAMRLRFRASPRAQDKKKIMALVGADKIERGLSDKTVSNSEAEAMAWSVYENRYFVTLNRVSCI